jgi:hypothetical protein
MEISNNRKITETAVLLKNTKPVTPFVEWNKYPRALEKTLFYPTTRITFHPELFS